MQSDPTKKVLVVFTGGTIGSTLSDGIINVSDAATFKLLELFEKNYKNHKQITFTPIRPIEILSENLAPCVWNILISSIESENPDKYDGIIITHGTDTLAYTAAALSFYYNAIKIPILLVSSDYPLNDLKSNGVDNFICAVDFILQNVQSGVFVPYRNQQQVSQVHSGARLACSLQLTGNFFSVQDKSYMRFENHKFIPSQHNKMKDIIVTDYSLKASFSERILMIKPYPGLNYSHFNIDGVVAVLHDLYHSGTACTLTTWGVDYSLPEFIKCCTSKGIKTYLAPAVKTDDAYQSTKILIDQGASMIWNMSIEAAYVKLMLAYGNFTNHNHINEFINKDIAGEFV
jgi:L-asparaginase